jgi:putative spermidine/putrescine transport system permease protein
LHQLDDPRVWRLLLILPLAVSFLLFAIPQYFFITMSLHPNLGYGRIGEVFTIDNYARIFADPIYSSALARTLSISVTTAAVCLALGLPMAYVLARTQSRWIPLLVGLLVAANFIAPVVKDLGVIILLGKNGLVNLFLGVIGAVSQPITWIGSQAAVVIGLVHYSLPLTVLLLISVIQTVPISLEHAAHVHGASRLRVFYGVIIPIIKPGLLAAALMVFNLAAGSFTTPALLGGARIVTFPILIQRATMLDVDYPFASALSSVLLVFVFALNVFAGYLLRKQLRTGDPLNPDGLTSKTG